MKRLLIFFILATGLTACNQAYKFNEASSNLASSEPDLPPPPTPECTPDYTQWVSDGTASVQCPDLCPDGSSLQCTAQVEKEMVCSNGFIADSGQTRYSAISAPQTSCPAPATKDVVETYDVPSIMGKADILVELDTTGSMATTLTKLSKRLGTLTSKFGKIDWQVGITNVGIGKGFFYGAAMNGKLMPIKKSPLAVLTPNIKILTKNTPYASYYFEQSITHPTGMSSDDSSTFCSLAPFCMDFWVKPQPMNTITAAIAEAPYNNKGFFRSGSYFVPIIISDADENEKGGSDAVTPQTAIKYFKDTFGNTMKDMIGFSIVIPPGDSACLKKHQNLFSEGTFGKYGTFAANFANLTGGKVLSLCDDDYTDNLAAISDKVREKIESIPIHQVPISGTLQVSFSPAANIGWTLVGDKIVFDKELPVGTRVTITYKVKNN
jgi:hypothetical protein